MKKIEIRVPVNRNQERRISPVMLLFLLCGVYGILFFLRALDGISFAEWTVYPAATVCCFLLWGSHFYSRKLFAAVCLFFVTVCGVEVFFRETFLQQQASYVMDSLQGRLAVENVRVTEFALFFAAVLSFLIFVLEFLLKSHALLYLLTTLFLLLSPLFGVRIHIGTLLLLALFQMAFWSMQLAGLNRWEIVIFPKSRHRLAGAGSAVVGGILAVAFLLAVPLVSLYSARMYDSAYRMEGFLYRTRSQMSGSASEPITGGYISRGNNYRTGTVQLELMASSKPEQTLYLRGFGGGEYIGGDWIRSSDEALFEHMTESDRWEDIFNLERIASYYYGMYYEMNENMQAEEPPEAISLTVQHASGNYENAYVPYYSKRQSSYTMDGRLLPGYTYRYYEQEDMHIVWENVSSEFEEMRDWYLRLQDAYLVEAKEAYTKVPVELLPKLTKLVKENPLIELEEITAFILYTLHSNASYTLTPGWAARNEDIVEYFLFGSGSGYCEHFAATATLMYRLYGIPARYATGYMVSPSDFMEQEDGSFQAFVTDEDAHAWAEIFLPDYGWTPVEVTPASDGSTVASYPGFDNAQYKRQLLEHGWEMEDSTGLPPVEQTEKNVKSEDQEAGEISLNFHIDLVKYREIFLIIGSCLLYTVLLLPLFLDYRRLRLQRKRDAMDCREVFAGLLKLLHFYGILPEYDGTERDFASCLASAVSAVSESEAGRLQDIVIRAAYGQEAPSEEECEFVRRIYHRIADEIYGGLTRRKKLIFKYCKAFD